MSSDPLRFSVVREQHALTWVGRRWPIDGVWLAVGLLLLTFWMFVALLFFT
jgi:hypothetical protein